ncbi:aldo/keto reductase [Nocardioides litoris]|uniref:aldo/keto reductase n=1 Tax=Nocardioides litoris TaxID=1926648 RepID=UPI001FE62E81|nr:aldo/keto reductase [Nocardioides litoris]
MSPLALGAATFGDEWGWGATKDEARRMFDTYVDRGGNFVDTADVYTDGTSEVLVGEFARHRRDSLVIATKYSSMTDRRDPNSGGGPRKNMMTSVESSLRRLGTDHVDVLYLHVWDDMTPVEETLRGMDDLVRQGKVHYVAMSSAPAWQVSRMQAIADLRGWSPLVALQVEYNLLDRTPERDLVPMAREMGLGVVPFSPLAGGVLSGSYSRSDLGAPASEDEPDGTRRHLNRALGTVTERNLAIADEVRDIAHEVGRSPAQVALAWVLHRPGVTAPILGARTVEQLEGNLGALEVDLDPQHLDRLETASAFELGAPHALLASDHIRAVTRGDLVIQGRG